MYFGFRLRVRSASDLQASHVYARVLTLIAHGPAPLRPAIADKSGRTLELTAEGTTVIGN